MVPDDPADIGYTPKELFWMFESAELNSWMHTAHLEARINNASATKRSHLKKPIDLLPKFVKDLLKDRSGGRQRTGPGVTVSREQFKAAVLGTKKYKAQYRRKLEQEAKTRGTMR